MIWKWRNNCILREHIDIGGFPFLLSWLIILYSHMLDNYGNNLSTVVMFLDWKLQIHLRFNHIYITDVTNIKLHPLYSKEFDNGLYRMSNGAIHISKVYVLWEPSSVPCWVNLVLFIFWIHIYQDWNNHIVLLTRLDIHGTLTNYEIEIPSFNFQYTSSINWTGIGKTPYLRFHQEPVNTFKSIDTILAKFDDPLEKQYLKQSVVPSPWKISVTKTPNEEGWIAVKNHVFI